MPNTSADHAERVLRILRTRCSAARVRELATATGLAELEVIDALYELERSGQVTPTSGGWPTSPSPSARSLLDPAGGDETMVMVEGSSSQTQTPAGM